MSLAYHFIMQICQLWMRTVSSENSRQNRHWRGLLLGTNCKAIPVPHTTDDYQFAKFVWFGKLFTRLASERSGIQLKPNSHHCITPFVASKLKLQTNKPNQPSHPIRQPGNTHGNWSRLGKESLASCFPAFLDAWLTGCLPWRTRRISRHVSELMVV